MSKSIILAIAMLFAPSVHAQTKAGFSLMINGDGMREGRAYHEHRTWVLDGGSRQFSNGGLLCTQIYRPNPEDPTFDMLSVVCTLAQKDVEVSVRVGCFINRKDSDESVTLVKDGTRKGIAYDIVLSCESPRGK